MGFELPLALLGMLAAAFPLLAHRMRKRELPRIQLPTFALVTRAAARSLRKRTLQDVLLLALRIAVLVTAALALATPYVTANVPFGDGRTAALVIVIDDSLSMARKDDGSSLFARARARAELVASTLPAGSELGIVLAGKPARVLHPLGRELASASAKLSALEAPPTRADDTATAISLATRELAGTQLAERRLLLLSDFARHVDIGSSLANLDGVEVAAERVGRAADGGNAYISSASTAPDPTQPQQTSVAVEVRSLGNVPARVRIEITRGSSVVAHAQLTLVNGGGRSVLHVPTPDDNDDPRASVRLVLDDALLADNEAGIVLTRADSMRVLLVNGDPHPASDADELRYVSHALSLLPETLLSLSARSVDPGSLPYTKLTSYDVVVLANVPAPDTQTAAALTRFVRGGGGLIVGAGHRVDAASYNAALGTVLAAHITGSAASNLRFAHADPDFLPEGMAGLREARTTRRVTVDTGAELLLAFEDGSPAIAGRDVGDGRSLLITTTLDADDTDLPLRPGFLPLLVALMRDAAGAAAIARRHVAPGEAFELPIAKRAGSIEISTPSRKTHALPLEARARSARFDATTELGAYRVYSVARDTDSERTPRGAFVVVAPSAESDLTPAAVLPGARGGPARATSSQIHRSLASFVFLLAGLLALAEGLLRVRPRAGVLGTAHDARAR
jgi:von Willebrand factor type A domain/Aerotolerance regulator N-terminal